MNAKWTAISVLALFAVSLTAGGCVSLNEHRDVLAANDRAQAQLGACQAELQGLLAARGQAAEELRLMQLALGQKDDTIKGLHDSITSWERRYADLNALYTDATRKDETPQPLSIAALPAELDKALQDWAAQNPGVEYDRKRGMVKFKTDVLFAKGSDDVTAEAQSSLAGLAKVLSSVAAAKFHVYIAGHTDDVPIGKDETRKLHPSNWYLSVHRAVSVREALAGAGVPNYKIGAMGFSEYHPIEPNAPGKKGNPRNRRVEIWIVPPSRFLTTPGSPIAGDGGVSGGDVIPEK